MSWTLFYTHGNFCILAINPAGSSYSHRLNQCQKVENNWRARLSPDAWEGSDGSSRAYARWPVPSGAPGSSNLTLEGGEDMRLTAQIKEAAQA